MSTPSQSGSTDRISSFSCYRARVLRQAAELVGSPSASDDAYRAQSFPQVSALLVSTIDKLRLAEEQLQRQHDDAVQREEELRHRLEYARRLFESAPSNLLATNLMGAISDANRAAKTLLGEDAYQLDRKPLVSFVPTEDRRAFRGQLERLTIVEGTTDWRFRVLRRRGTPVTVSAAVNVVEGGGLTGETTLLWCLRPLPDGA